MSIRLLQPSIIAVAIEGQPQEVYARLAAHAPERSGLVLLHSSKIMPELSAWSYVSGPAVAKLEAHEGICVLSTEINGEQHKLDQWDNPFEALHECFSSIRGTTEAPTSKEATLRPEGLHWTSGWVGFFGYDLTRHMEPLPEQAQSDPDWPELLLYGCDHVLAFNHAQSQWYFCTMAWPLTDIAKRQAVWQQTLQQAQEVLTLTPSDEPLFKASTLHSLTPSESFLQQVQKVLEWIRAGDIFQANLSHRLEGEFSGDAFALYERLIELNPAPFSAFIQEPNFALASVSPERFLKLNQGRISARPIKGTRPRGRSPQSDEQLKNDLALSTKDRAENLMIVDLMRNDLGRVAQTGSVQVEQLFEIEAHPSVWQMVSHIKALLKPELNAADLIKACWPPGSMTGAPKIRAMQIIESLEPTRRGPYAGAIGYVDVGGDMDLSVVIRTALVHGSKVMVQVGGGIVSDSQPQAELDETYDKANLLVKALMG